MRFLAALVFFTIMAYVSCNATNGIYTIREITEEEVAMLQDEGVFVPIQDEITGRLGRCTMDKCFVQCAKKMRPPFAYQCFENRCNCWKL